MSAQITPAVKALNKVRLKKLQDASNANEEALQHEASARELRDGISQLQDEANQIATAIGILGGELIEDRNDARLVG